MEFPKPVSRILYPFVEEIKVVTGYDTIYLVEDNAPCHQIVQRVDKSGESSWVCVLLVGLPIHSTSTKSNDAGTQ
jgi:hypothetical protein